MRAVIQQVKLPDTGRIIAISDVHGNLPYLKGLLAKLALRDEDTLVFCGDILEKGRYSLETLRYIMRLASERRVLAVLGNCDFWQDAIYRPTPDVYKRQGQYHLPLAGADVQFQQRAGALARARLREL